MFDREPSRRDVLKVVGGTLAAGGVTATAVTGAAGESSDSDWVEASTPTGKSIFDVVQTVNGPYAVGSSGNILARSGGWWELVVDSGPSTKENSLYSVDVTDDGKYIWFAGGSGALGYFDVTTGRKYDHTAPMEKTSTWEGIGVAGVADEESIYVANGSGEVLDGHRDDDACMQWDEVVKPGGGSTIPEVDFQAANTSRGYAVDTSQQVYRTTDGGDTWSTVGVEDAQVAFYDVLSYDDTVLVAGGSGRVYRRDCDCNLWTPVDVGAKTVHALSRDGDTVLGAGGSGRVYERTADGWDVTDAPVGADLLGVAYGDDVDVAVGSSGTILERPR